MTRISDPAILIPRALDGDRRSLARLITLVEDGRPVGVLDLDSTTPGRFDEEDREGLLLVVRLLEEARSGSLQI